MGMIDSNALIQTPVHRWGKFHPSTSLLPKASPSFYRVADSGIYAGQEKIEAGCDTKGAEWIGQSGVEGHFRVMLIGAEQGGQAIRLTLTSHLKLDFHFMEARSGRIALNSLGRELVDLIIFGDDTADMDGLEFLDRLKQQKGKSRIPVIEMLNSGAANVGVQAMKMGAHDYLLKDFDGHHFELLPILVSRIYTEQQAMNALRKTAGVHQTIADSIPSVIYRLSLQGGRHDVCISPHFSELGLSADKWGNDAELHHQMCHEEDRPHVKQALEHSYQTGTKFQCEYRINTFDGALRWFHDKAKVIMDKYGRPLFLQGVMTDISGLKSLEEELKRYRSMMDKMVRQRTERLDRRVAILESCNSSLSENYDRMRQRYLDLLVKAQAQEGGIA